MLMTWSSPPQAKDVPLSFAPTTKIKRILEASEMLGAGIQQKAPPLLVVAKPVPAPVVDDILYTDGSGKRPAEPARRKCGAISCDTTSI
eukprot:2645995-Amphidinium_carterae.1